MKIFPIFLCFFTFPLFIPKQLEFPLYFKSSIAFCTKYIIRCPSLAKKTVSGGSPTCLSHNHFYLRYLILVQGDILEYKISLTKVKVFLEREVMTMRMPL